MVPECCHLSLVLEKRNVEERLRAGSRRRRLLEGAAYPMCPKHVSFHSGSLDWAPSPSLGLSVLDSLPRGRVLHFERCPKSEAE